MTEQETINQIPEAVWTCITKAPAKLRYSMIRANIVIYFNGPEYSFKRLAIYNVLKAELDRRTGNEPLAKTNHNQ